MDRPDYVFPNDRLNYLVRLDSKLPYPIEIESDMQIFIGDKNVTMKQSLSHTLHLSPIQQNDVINYNFTAHEGGLNTIKVNLKIINGTNKAILENKLEILKFDVQSQAIQLQVESNRNTQWGIILSTSAAFASIIFLGYQTMKLREEKKLTLRAWMGDTGNHIIILRYFNNRGGIKTKEEWTKMSDVEKSEFNFSETEYAILIKNFGQVPATNVSGRYLPVLGQMPARSDITSSAFEFFSVVLPNDEKYHTFRLNLETTDAISDRSKKVYFIFEVRYNSGKSKEEHKFGFIADFSHGVYVKLDTWDEESFNKKS
ncbi:MAG: hypothetical protein ACRDFB_07380 [Rhabdochlamydiaceae bacterium]